MRPLVPAALILLLGVSALTAEEPSFQDLEESLTCQCGCGLTVHACNHVHCPSAIPLRQEIRAQMALGLDRDAILARFEKKYGEKILSSPTMRGFNLTAWIMPFLMVALGGMLVVLTLLRWRRGTARPAVHAQQPAPGQGMSEYESVLNRELERFDS